MVVAGVIELRTTSPSPTSSATTSPIWDGRPRNIHRHRLFPSAGTDALQRDAAVIGLLIVGGIGHWRLPGTRRRLGRSRLAVARNGDRTLPARPHLARG